MINHLKNKHSDEHRKLQPTLPRGQEITDQDTGVNNPSTSMQLSLEECAEMRKPY